MTKKAYTIGIDCRFAGTHSGIGRYVRELVLALAKRNDPWNYVLYLPETPHGLENTESNRMRHSSFVIRHYSIREQFLFPQTLKESSVNLLHVPHFNAPLFCPVPFVMTIHDLILHQYPNEASFFTRSAYRLLLRNAVRKSAHILAVSHATKNDLVHEYGQSTAAKTTVVWNGIGENFGGFLRANDDRRAGLRACDAGGVSREAVPLGLLDSPCTDRASRSGTGLARRKLSLPDRFILYIGAAKEHKNVQTLIDACPENMPLILVTNGKEVQKLRLRPNVRILSDVSEEDLPALYGAASCFVTASLAEGFGLPILEAMACGCPVIASNRGSIPELCDGHAILVEPTVEGISAGIRRALTEPFDPEATMAHARTFLWERAAEETARIYDLCLRKAQKLG